MTADDVAHNLMTRPLRNGGGWLTLCPVHGDTHPSLSLKDGEDGKLLVHCFSGCDPLEILKTLRERGLSNEKSFSRPLPERRPEPAKDRSEILNRIYRETRPVEAGGIVARYLGTRGITLMEWSSDLREHPSLSVYESGKPTGQRLPAMGSVIRNPEGRPAGLHLTFIRADGTGKADIPNPRRIIGVKEGSTRGGAVRLFEPKDGALGLGEGVESTLSGSILTGIPGWACLSAGGLERVQLPEKIRSVVIFADRDPAGLSAAKNACRRFRDEGPICNVLAPDKKGTDFNDLLIMKNARSA